MIASGGKPLLLREAVAAIHRAAEDPRVAGLIARVQIPAAAAGPVQELRDAIAAFSDVKPSLAWAETYPGTLSYYLASAFREVWMQPSGTVGLVGFATNALFLRDALDKAGIEAQFIARGEYKSAANLFTQDRYTDAHREADSRLIESLHTQVWQAVAESRHLDPPRSTRSPTRRRCCATTPSPDAWSTASASATRPTPASANSLAHRVFRRRPATPTPTTRRRGCICRGTPAPRRRGRRRRCRRFPAARRKPTIAVVTLHGPIVSGRGGPQLLPFGNSSAGGDTIAAALREAAADDSVSAIVLRVDSPGGSVTGSETIWREVNRVRDGGKPVVASMGAVAASGGYYVSMCADAIVANAGTITGSIGVVTGKLVARELKDRLGVGSDSVRTNPNADAWSINQPFTDEQHAHVEAEADLFYTDFVERVAQGRKMTVEAVDAIARGRVWTGADALERGLVDELGGLRTAITRAKVLAGLRTRRRRPSCELSGLVADGHAAAQAVVAACRGVAAGGGRRAARPFGGRGARPGRAVVDRRQRALARRLPLLNPGRTTGHCGIPQGPVLTAADRNFTRGNANRLLFTASHGNLQIVNKTTTWPCGAEHRLLPPPTGRRSASLTTRRVPWTPKTHGRPSTPSRPLEC